MWIRRPHENAGAGFSDFSNLRPGFKKVFLQTLCLQDPYLYLFMICTQRKCCVSLIQDFDVLSNLTSVVFNCVHSEVSMDPDADL